MNQQIFEGHWKEIKGLIQRTWGEITNDEVSKMKGTYQELEGLLEKKYGYKKQKSEEEIRDFLKKNKIG